MVFSNIFEKIKAYETIIIHRHQNPDPDALGSQVGLKELLAFNFPEKQIYAVGYDEPSLAWMATMDKIDDNVYQGALVIVCDTANVARIDDVRYRDGDYLIKIDHHPNDDAYGDLLYVDTSASSTSEIITDFAFSLDLDMTYEAARLLYAGILGDTGRFLYPSTSSKTFLMASYLRSYAFDFSKMARQMDSFPLKIAKLQAYVFENLEIDKSGAARVIIPKAVLTAYGVTDAESSAIVGTPGKIDSVESWGIFVEQSEGRYRVRLRSKSAVINDIAKRHDGGGHPLASGANSYSLEENDQIYQELKDLLAK